MVYDQKIMNELPKHFDFADQQKIYKRWEENGFFKPKVDKKKKPFTIIMPPPNANGSLHLGHAVFVTLEDIMIRYNRMKGIPSLWLPGADHAGFETQVVFEKRLEKEGKNRFEMSREELYQATLDFTLANKEIMENQLRELGASCDWSREKFTLDQGVIKVVYQTFKDLFDDGLAYRDERPVNWCPKHQTSLSDLEVKYEEQKDPLYYIKYGPLTLATVRPETKFGDTAVAVHPDDKRYQKYIGKEIEYQTVLGKAKLMVIADEYVDPKFGTGVVKITPAHDPNDFEVAKRHNLPIKEAIDRYGRMTEIAGPYAGMKVAEARKAIVEEMQKRGLIEKIDENYIHSVAKCYKCGNTIEPRILTQWFIAVNKKGSKTGKTIASDALKAVQSQKVVFSPRKFTKVYNHWMDNIRDWNISRQIVWGIRIPAWYCEDCGEIMVETEAPKKCQKCKSTKLTQDQDVFDTWFSSGQWPYATLKTSEKGDFDYFYPTSVLETAYDILFFWVARMIMLGIYRTGEAPFHTVVLHGLVRDKDKKKMSKSKGNVIDPLGVVEIYGADALRMALIFGTEVGNDIVISEEKIKGFRNFTTKVWNASRFTISNLDKNTKNEDPKKLVLTKEDKWILKELEKTTEKVTKHIENYHFHRGAEDIYEFFWHKFCDKCIENTKNRIYDEKATDLEKRTAQWVLYKVLTDSLKLMHPFMPFVTEAIWEALGEKEALIISSWPE
jgi:valyl-tRNA synthetase